MSAALDTVKAFSDTLANELAQAVKEQDAATVMAFTEIAAKISEARDAFIERINTIEEAFGAAIRAATEARSRAMKENGATLDQTIEEIASVINEVKARYA